MKPFLAIGSLLLVVSVACTASRSAGSPSSANSNATVAQSSAQTSNPIAQDKPTCQLTLAGAPDIKGLRLGMTTEEVLALFPGSKDDAEVRASLSRPPSQFGVSSFQQLDGCNPLDAPIEYSSDRVVKHRCESVVQSQGRFDDESCIVHGS